MQTPSLPQKDIILENQTFTIIRKSGYNLVEFTTYLLGIVADNPTFFMNSIVYISKLLLSGGYSIGKEGEKQVAQYQELLRGDTVTPIASIVQSFLMGMGTDKAKLKAFTNEVLNTVKFSEGNVVYNLNADNISKYLKDFQSIYKLLWLAIEFQYEDLLKSFLVVPQEENLG